VPFVAIHGGADDARYAVGLVIVSMSPQIELRIEGLHRHNLNFMEVPDHSIRRVISSNNGEYLGLSGYPRRNETFGLIYIIEMPEGLAEVVLLMNPDGKVTTLVHGDEVILLDEEE